MSQNKNLDALLEYIVDTQEYVPLSADAKIGVDMLIDVQSTLKQEDTPIAVCVAGKFYCLECRSFVSQDELNARVLHPGWTIACELCHAVLAPVTLSTGGPTQPLAGGNHHE